MSHVEAFEQALADRPVTVDRITATEFPGRIEAQLDPPAVGVPLPFEGVSLSGLPVELNPTPSELTAATTGVTPVGPAVAEYGSVVVQSGVEGAEGVSLYPDKHVAVLAASDVVGSLTDAVAALSGPIADGDLSSAVIATGPSGTADMGSLVYGAHGPETVHVVVLEDR
ncbi:LUD domain-containing protein [Halostella salina]|uniref:LUD domain-containing protein n=1 Tax=Halostella salina TaxID=1547897 RepID=UPI000EF79307|nr:LUD domain-containing protein [Halostella salina]